MDAVIASATPWGHSALAVVRLTGSDTREVLGRIIAPMGEGPIPVNRSRRIRLVDRNGVFDDGVVIVGEAPRTYTGEDTAEITCHGNPQIVERLLAAAVDAGARLARPGEFTRRAVSHGKLDLVRAEAVLQISRASSQRGLEIGRSGMDGRLSAFFHTLRGPLVEAAAELEARMDYPADELALQEDRVLITGMVKVAERCEELAQTFQAGKVLVSGARVALVGPVNAGKSSLFNALVGRTRALVHETPGTTRDVLEVSTVLNDVAVTLLDTAGQRKTHDPVEAAGLALARELVDEADALLVVLRARPEGLNEVETRLLEHTRETPRVVVYNGVDRADHAPAPSDAVCTIAPTGAGLAELKQALTSVLVGEEMGGGALVIASARQRDQLLAVSSLVREGVAALPVAGVAVAADAITRAVEEIDALTGMDTRETVLDALFSKFCIGK